MTVCTSCKAPSENSRGTATFLCPKCSKFEIVRCSHCRTIAAAYSCAECGFAGPN